LEKEAKGTEETELEACAGWAREEGEKGEGTRLTGEGVVADKRERKYE